MSNSRASYATSNTVPYFDLGRHEQNAWQSTSKEPDEFSAFLELTTGLENQRADSDARPPTPNQGSGDGLGSKPPSLSPTVAPSPVVYRGPVKTTGDIEAGMAEVDGGRRLAGILRVFCHIFWRNSIRVVPRLAVCAIIITTVVDGHKRRGLLGSLEVLGSVAIAVTYLVKYPCKLGADLFRWI